MRCGRLPATATGATGALPRMPLAFQIAGLLMLPLVLAASDRGWQRLAALLMVAPILEETVFRAGIQEALLRRWQGLPHLANTVTALAFGASHALVRGDPAAFAVALPALLIGAVYQRTGRLLNCMGLHAAMNAAWLAWSMAGPGLSGGR